MAGVSFFFLIFLIASGQCARLAVPYRSRARSVGNQQCEVISVHVCKNYLTYYTTRLPNVFGHIKQSDVALGVQQLYPIIQTKCNPHITEFLCSMHLPACTGSKSMTPCRSFCAEVKSDCYALLSSYGFKWPESMDCERLPIRGQCYSGKDKNNLGQTSRIKLPNRLSSPGERITEVLCQDMPYSVTRYPNFLRHARQEDASLEINQFYPLIQASRSRHLKQFLCSVYIPPLTGKSEVILPCRDLCVAARDSVGNVLKLVGYPWPEKLTCELFPQTGPCFAGDYISRQLQGLTSSSTKVVPPTTTSPVNKVTTGGPGEQIVIPMCKSMPYNKTRFPNVFGHRTQEDVGLEVHQFFPMTKVQCSEHLQSFLCSAYVPPITETGDIALPCRDLCQRSRDGCEPLMRKYGFSWPNHLNCQRFPTTGPCFNGSSISRQLQGSTSSSTKDVPPTTTSPVNKVTAVGPGEQIVIPMCKNMPYNKTRFPNVFGHRKQEDVGLEVHQFFPMIKVQCSEHLQSFLCSAYVPPITEKGDIALPCRDLCQRSRDGCEPLMRKFGFLWPNHLSCQRFPTTGPCFNGSSISRQLQGSTSSSTKVVPPTTTSPVNNKVTTGGPGEQIVIPMCENMPYNKTRFPNVFGHRKQEDAALEINQFYPLVKTECSEHLQSFLCSAYVPPITETGDIALPCRDLCQRSRDGCEPLMRKYGFPWPDKFRCEWFPTKKEGCIDGKSFPEGQNSAKTTEIGSKESEDNDNVDEDAPTDCVVGDFNCRHATSRAHIDGKTTCCFNERQITYKSGCDSSSTVKARAPVCRCVYPTPADVSGHC